MCSGILHGTYVTEMGLLFSSRYEYHFLKMVRGAGARVSAQIVKMTRGIC